MSTATATPTTRAARAAERLAYLRSCAPEHRAQAYDSWLELATAAEVRRYWRPWMSRSRTMPAWAAK